MAEGSGHVVSRNLANVQVERSNQANLLVENDAFDRHVHARVSSLCVNQYYCVTPHASHVYLAPINERKKKKKKKRKEWKNIFLLATPLPLLRRNHKSLFTISARLSSFSYVSQRKYWISMNMISKDINFENARGYLTYIRYSRFVSYKNISHKKHNLTIIFQ